MTQGSLVQNDSLGEVSLKKDNMLEAARVDTTDLGSGSEEPEEISKASLQVLLVEKEDLLAQKDEQLANMRALVSRLETRLLSLEERLREQQRERFVRVGKPVEELREQLADELRKRQAAQYELIEKAQRILELEPKLAESEQTIKELQQQLETVQDLRTTTTVLLEDTTPRSSRLPPKGGSTPRASARQVAGCGTPQASSRPAAPVVALDLSRASLEQYTPVQAPAPAVVAAETTTAERGAQVRRIHMVAPSPAGSFVAAAPCASTGVPRTPRASPSSSVDYLSLSQVRASPSASVPNFRCQDAGPFLRAASPVAFQRQASDSGHAGPFPPVAFRGGSPWPWAAAAPVPQLPHAGPPCSVAWSNAAKTPRTKVRI